MKTLHIGLWLSLSVGAVLAQAEGDWPNMHGGDAAWHYSALDEIDSTTIKGLSLAWTFALEEEKSRWMGSPVASQGLLALCVNRQRVAVLEGATGKMKWQAEIALGAGERSCDGLAIDQGTLYVSAEAGQIAAFKLEEGTLLWSYRLPARESGRPPKLGPPMVFSDHLVLGTDPDAKGVGEIIALNPKTGEELWRTRVVPPGDTRLRGVSTAYPGSYDPESKMIYWGTGSPWPLFDAVGGDYLTRGVRAGVNEYSAGVLAIDLSSGERRAWHQELPHEGWVLNSAASQLILLPKDKGAGLIHLNRMGLVLAYTPSLTVRSAWLGIKNFTLAQSLDPGSGAFFRRREFSGGQLAGVCPLVHGGFPASAAAFHPKTQLLYVLGAEWCMDVTPKSDGTGPLGGDWVPRSPAKERARGHLDARDPVTGQKRWTMDFAEPPMAGVLATAGNLIFVADARGRLAAVDALTGRRLWSDQAPQGYVGAVLTYRAEGHQVVVATSGWQSDRFPEYAKLFGVVGAPGRPTVRAYRLP